MPFSIEGVLFIKMVWVWDGLGLGLGEQGLVRRMLGWNSFGLGWVGLGISSQDGARAFGWIERKGKERSFVVWKKCVLIRTYEY